MLHTCYLAGPMSGYPQSNFPYFIEVASTLREAGWNIISPAELDDDETVRAVMAGEPAPHTWGDFLARDVKLIADSDIRGMVLLRNWYMSRGARLEAFVGLLKSPDFVFYRWLDGAEEAREISRESVKAYLGSFTQ